MKCHITFIAAAIFAAVPSVHAQSGGLVDVLRANGLENFANFLESNAPLTLARVEDRMDVTVFAPQNSVIDSGPPSRNRRRTPEEEAEAAAQMTDDDPPPPERKMKRQQQQYPDTNYRVLRTFLNDPSFINIGGEYLSITTNYASPQAAGDEGADLEIQTGRGNIVNATGQPIKFNNGVIYKVDDWFTLPALLSETLETGGADSFLAAIRNEDLLSEMDGTPRITVFAPQGEMPSGDTAKGYVAYDYMGYSPELVPGKTYGDMAITKKDGQLYANGRKILQRNIPIKNGVLHYLDEPEGSADPTPTNTPPNSTSTLSPPSQFTGAATTLKGVSGGMVGMLGIGLGLWMAI